jgi:hypothetical protein
MPNTYLDLDAGVPTRKAAIDSSAGAGDAGKIPALDGSGRLNANMMPSGIGADTATVQASENLAAGDFVNIWNDGGDFRVRKADGVSAGKEAHGFVLSVVTSGNPAEVYFEGANTQMTALTAGKKWLSVTTAGGVQAAAPTTAGQVSQVVGVAVSATEINVEVAQHYVL